MRSINPFRLIPAEDRYFVGREAMIDEWRQRLTTGSEGWKAGKGWLILAAGGLGKTSLLIKLGKLAQQEFEAHVVEVDFGLYRDLRNPEGLFSALESQIADAPELGTRARKRVGLPSEASQTELLYQYAAELLKLTGFQVNFGPIGFSPSLPEKRTERTEDFALRVAGIFLKLRGIASRSKRPVVVMLDQLGKAYDDLQWTTIARLLLGGMLRFQTDAMINIIFVVAMRPERYALLEARMQRSDLFDQALFLRKYLSSFHEQDARQAIRVRAQAHIPPQLETDIVQAIDLESDGIDPYRLIEAAGAVWTYLYGGEQQRSAGQLTPEDVGNILTSYYREATRYVRETDETQWQVLKILTHYPGGLSIAEIAEKLTNSSVSDDVQRAVINLLNQPGYQFIARMEQAGQSPRFRVAHELLQQALLQEIPENERFVEQARKTYEDAIWRFIYRKDILSDKELKAIWENRDLLNFRPTGMRAITNTLLHDWRSDRIEWLIHYPAEIVHAIKEIEIAADRQDALERSNLIIYSLQKSLEDRLRSAASGFANLAKHSPLNEVRYEAVIKLANLGQIAREKLLEIVQGSYDIKLCFHAAKGLAQLGERGIALKLFIQLVNSGTDEQIRENAITGMAELGEVAQEPLLDLIMTSSDRRLRLQAVRGLGYVGISSRDLLADLVWKSQDEKMRLEAVRCLAKLGIVSQDLLLDIIQTNVNNMVGLEAAIGLSQLGMTGRNLLVDLARNSQNEEIHFIAAAGLIEHKVDEHEYLINTRWIDLNDWVRLQESEYLAHIGETLPAREILVDLAKNSTEERVRIKAISLFPGMGDNLLNQEILVDLCRNSSDKDVRLQAAAKLAETGETHIALDVLTHMALYEWDDWERQKAVELLAMLGEASQEILIDIAKKKSSPGWLRQYAVGGLTKLGELSREVLSDLVWNSDSEGVRWKAANGLSNFGIASLDILSNLARNSSDKTVRHVAAEGLAKIGTPAKEVLIDLAWNSSDDKVRIYATRGLANMGDAVQEVLINLAWNSSDDEVRKQAISGLCGVEKALVTRESLASLIRTYKYQNICRMTSEWSSKLDVNVFLLCISLENPLNSQSLQLLSSKEKIL